MAKSFPTVGILISSTSESSETGDLICFLNIVTYHNQSPRGGDSDWVEYVVLQTRFTQSSTYYMTTFPNSACMFVI